MEVIKSFFHGNVSPKKKKIKTLGVSLLILILLMPLFSTMKKVEAIKPSEIEGILAGLSSEQKEAIRSLQANEQTGMIGFAQQELMDEKDTTVIVEFHADPVKEAVLSASLKGKALSSRDAQKQIQTEHESFSQAMKKKKVSVEEVYQTTFNGMAITLPGEEIESLLALKEVKAVYKNQTYSIEPMKEFEQEEPNTPHMADSIRFLGVDRLHQEGITGKGIKVGVIDTGVDYHHPDLQDAYRGGYDLVDGDEDPMETTYDDWEASGRPLVDGGFNFYYTAHGTHVSGTIAGQASNDGGVSVKGVAPDVDLYAYRVLGPYGSGTMENILAGIEKAVEDDMDVINLSLGGNFNNPMDPTSIAVNNAVLNGVVAVVSAGNTGSGDYSLGTPGAAALALTVGASSTSLPISRYTASIGDTFFQLQHFANDFISDLTQFKNQSLPIVDIGVGTEEDYEGKDVKGKVVLVNTGEIGTQNKIVYAKEHGAKAIVVYHKDPDLKEISIFVGEDHRFLPSFYMTNEEGLKLKELIASGQGTIDFSDYKVVETKEDILADFSSRGPTRGNFDIKPEITAPGVSVLSTVPSYAVAADNYQFAYDRYSGTSMATPHITGIAALMLQTHPDYQPEDIKTILMNTAVPLKSEYSVFDVGAGRVDPYEALHTKVKFMVNDQTETIEGGRVIETKERTGGISFGSVFPDEGHIREQKTITVSNQGDEKKQFSTKVEFTKESLDPNKNGIRLEMEKTIQVKANQKVDTNVFMLIPQTAEIGTFEGYITITNKKNADESYRIPFTIRTMEGGFYYTDLSSKAFSPPYVHVKRNYFAHSSVDLQMSFKSAMKSMDVLLYDGKTDEPLGFLGTVNLESLYDDTSYSIWDIFNGTYFAFTGNDEKPISTQTTYAEPGMYKIRLVAKSERDRIFEEDLNVYLDHTEPSLTSSLDEEPSPVLEYSPDQKTFSLDAEVKDSEVNTMIESGFILDKSVNAINYSLNGDYDRTIQMNDDGKGKLTLPIDQSLPVNQFSIYASDAANNRSVKQQYFLVPTGTPFGHVAMDQESIKMGETFQATLNLTNMKAFTSGEWVIPSKNLEIISATPHADLSKGARVSMERDGENTIISLELDDENEGDLSAIDLTARVSNESFIATKEMNPTFSYVNNGERNTILHAPHTFNIVPAFSEIYGSIWTSSFPFGTDYVAAGVKIRLEDSNGEVIETNKTFNRIGEYRYSNLPLTKDPLVLSIAIPGHFKIKQKLTIGIEKRGVLYGQLLQMPYWRLTPGDINQDDVIDVLDAIYIQESWGTTKREADINFDGKVDAKDMNHMVNHYLTQNTFSANPPTPKVEQDGKTLESILKELGINK
jgi:subtilisin family serine protease